MITGMPRIAIALRDFGAGVAVFRERLGMPVLDLSRTSVESLGARLAMCVPPGGSHIELMSPANPAAPLSQSLHRFLDRRGEGLFALMLEAADPDEEADELTARGLRVLPLMAGAGGRDVHPSSTHGVLIRVYPVDSFRGPRELRAPAEDVSLGLSGIARVSVAVGDLEHALTVYRDRLGLAAGAPSVDAVRGVRSALCTPPSGGRIELVSVDDPDKAFARPIADFLDAKGEGLFALVVQCEDLEAAAKMLVARGVGVDACPDAGGLLEVDPGCVFGARIRVERRPASEPTPVGGGAGRGRRPAAAAGR